MSRGRTNPVMMTRLDNGGRKRAPDRLIVEEPLEIRLDGRRVATTMRTPGHDYELAAGFVFAEGLLGGAPVSTVRYCATGSAVETEFNVVTVETGGAAPRHEPRLGTTTSSCGACGSLAIAQLAERLAPFPDPVPVDPAVLARVGEQARERQELFAVTGAVHAAACFALADGEVLDVREDVGRHNAVDKVVGRLLLDGRLPAEAHGLFVSGRASFEIVQKAWAAGFRALTAVSAPSSLAVETARTANLTLVAFVRGERMNIYAPAP